MKQSKKLEAQYEKLRSQIIAEILLLIKQHEDIEIQPELSVRYATGHDEQDEPLLIEEVGVLNVTVFHRGETVECVEYVRLTTETLIEILGEMEKSYESAQNFVKGN